MIRDVQENGISEDELQQIKVKWRSDYFSTLEGGRSGMPRHGLMHLLACFTLFDDDPQLVNSILDGFLAVTREEVHAVAKKYLRPENRAIVFRTPVKRMRRRRRDGDTGGGDFKLGSGAVSRAAGGVAEAHAGDIAEWLAGGAGGGALDSQISRRALFSCGQCAGGGSERRLSRK